MVFSNPYSSLTGVSVLGDISCFFFLQARYMAIDPPIMNDITNIKAIIAALIEGSSSLTSSSVSEITSTSSCSSYSCSYGGSSISSCAYSCYYGGSSISPYSCS